MDSLEVKFIATVKKLKKAEMGDDFVGMKVKELCEFVEALSLGKNTL